MTDAEFWAEVKANLREAYASALYWQELMRAGNGKTRTEILYKVVKNEGSI